jgi:four helix bundle suffix protein
MNSAPHNSHSSHSSPNSHPSYNSHSTHPSPSARHPSLAHPAPAHRGDTTTQHPIIPLRGDPRTLLSYKKAEVIYDITYRFAHKYLTKGDRTQDQMIQSARSGKQNISEGGEAARTSTETEIKLTNVARASLGELLDDYADFLRVHDQPIWDKDSKEALYIRDLGCRKPQTYELYRNFVETRPSHTIANIAICLIHQAQYLLDRQLAALEHRFVKDGGLRERMTRARIEARSAPRPKLP